MELHLIWGSDKFSSSRIYKELMDHPVVHQAFKWVWANPCQPKHKVFFWLLLKDRLSTRNILRRKHMVIDNYNCVICNDNVEETIKHLFIDCAFAKECCAVLGVNLLGNCSVPKISTTLRAQLQSDFFMVAIILMCCAIWTARNNLIFSGIQPNF